jgi:high affinity Mn2+ porin
MKKKLLLTIIFLLSFYISNFAQPILDTATAKNWSIHFQQTIITQYHPAFTAAYSGTNSLDPEEETKTSLTSTLYLGTRLWKNNEIYFNLEIGGGQGFSGTTGAAGFPNGEVYRVGDPAPQFNLARLFIKQIFPLSSTYSPVNDDENQIKTKKPDTYISLSLGKFSMIDFFDKNKFSNDPRTQFMNWALMDNGAWDYPANTKGYTMGIVGEYINPEWAVRLSTAMVAKSANGMDLEYNIGNAHSETVEIEHEYSLLGQQGTIRTLFFLTHADMGNYELATRLPAGDINIISTRENGRTKYGFGLNIEQNLFAGLGMFLRIGINDGKNETWMYTEIDQTLSGGILFTGSLWARNDDNAGVAFVLNRISNEHQAYLKAGGYGFIIGDGFLNYSPEIIFETFYSLKLFEFLSTSPDYQIIINPAYNSVRGPVSVLSIRLHVEI